MAEQKIYRITVIGVPRLNSKGEPELKDGKKQAKYIRSFNVPEGFGIPKDDKNKFIQVRLLSASSKTKQTVDTGEEKLTLKLPNEQRKGFPLNVFARQYPHLFNGIVKEIKEGRYTIEDEDGMEILLTDYGCPGAILAFKTPFKYYRTSRDPKTHKPVRFEQTRYSSDGKPVKIAVAVNTAEVFAYGDEAEKEEAMIATATEALRQYAVTDETRPEEEHISNAEEANSGSDQPDKKAEETDL